MLVVTVTFELKSGARKKFLPLVLDNASQSLSLEPGCRKFDVCSLPETPDEVFLYEIYDDEAALSTHKTMPHYLDFAAKTDTLIAAKTVKIYTLERHEAGIPSPRKGAILQERDRPVIRRGGGASTIQMVTPQSGAGAFLNGFTDILPGASIPLHSHNCEESVLIVAGQATVEVDGELYSASAGDVTWLPTDVPHRFINPSKTEPLRIFWTYASVSATRTIVETGETGPILAESPAA